MAKIDALADRAKAPRQISDTDRLADAARVNRDSIAARAAAILKDAEREGRNLTPSDHAAVNAGIRESSDWQVKYEDLQQRAEHTRSSRVVRESLTYEEGGPYSFFADALKAQHLSDTEAAKRIETHQREMRFELGARRAKYDAETRQARSDLGASFEQRVNPNRTPGMGGYASPPLWVIDRATFAPYPRPQRVLSRLCRNFPLPERPGFSSINLPRIATGAAAGVARDISPEVAQDFTDAACSTVLQPVTGHVDIAMQAVEQSPGSILDELIWTELLDAIDASVEQSILTGTGTNQEVLGILNVAEAGNVTFTASTPKAVELVPLLAQVSGYVADHRKIRPGCWLARLGRWNFIVTGEDLSERPLMEPASIESPTPPIGPVGALLGNIPVYTSESLPTNLGAGENQDTLLALVPNDLLLFESPPILESLGDVLSGTMELRIRAREYMGFVGNRYPSGICKLTGTGMKVPTNE